MPEQKGRLSEPERQDADELAAPMARVIYEVVRREGEEELRRPSGSLFWSGMAGGITLMASVIAEGALSRKLPAELPGREIIVDFGYGLGFLIVILGRMQLFTEQTVVAVLPVMAAPSWRNLRATGRLWAIVLSANLIGSCAAAWIDLDFHLVGPALSAAMLAVSGALLDKTPLDILLQGIPAGFLMASVAWIRAGTVGGEFWIVLTLTSAIALGDFTHVIAGSAEAFLLMFDGRIGALHVLAGIIAPALVGNIIGGTGLFALLAHAQVWREI
jgi:formate/nitrite transporter FocA (FNT family)